MACSLNLKDKRSRQTLYPQGGTDHAQSRDNLYRAFKINSGFSTWQQFITILYSQIKQKDSLRDIESGLTTQSAKWYHIGLRNVRRSMLSDANNQRVALQACAVSLAIREEQDFRDSIEFIA